jgi:2-keto-4-pentenoate hydratase
MSIASQSSEHKIPAIENDRMRQAAEILLQARRELKPVHDLPKELRPHTLDEAYALQDIVALALGPVGGWKIGAPAPGAPPLFSPMPLWGGFAASGDLLRNSLRRLRGVEAEIAFVLGRDLPVREEPYTTEEVTAAIATAHPVIELLESAFFDPDQAERLSVIGDLMMNGGFVYGPAVPNWRSIDLTRESVVVTIDGGVRFEGTASNTAEPTCCAWLHGLPTKAAREQQDCKPAIGSLPEAGQAKTMRTRDRWPMCDSQTSES